MKKLRCNFLMNFMFKKKNMYLNNKNHIYVLQLFIDSQVYKVGLSNKNDVSKYSEIFTEVQKLEEVK